MGLEAELFNICYVFSKVKSAMAEHRPSTAPGQHGWGNLPSLASLSLLADVAERELKNQEKDNECAICIETLGRATGEPRTCEGITVKRGDPCREVRLRCGHRFHYGCLVRYICETVLNAGRLQPSARRRQPLAPCPVCQQRFVVKDVLIGECADGENARARAESYADILQQGYAIRSAS